MHKLIDTKLHW